MRNNPHMTTLEERLKSWTGPSSNTEQEKQERAERMVREAIGSHPAISGVTLRVFAKGSYKNNTNVRADSDVDIAVEFRDKFYWNSHDGNRPSSVEPYTGAWTPEQLRSELIAALKAKFPGDVDASGKTAIKVGHNTARVDTDVVPCFSYRYYFASGNYREGTRVFKVDGSTVDNYPVQQYENGVAKNNETGRSFKGAVRILKRLENVLVERSEIEPLPSYFMECLGYNVPNAILTRTTWKSTMEGALTHIYNALEGPEPETGRWMEVNDIKYLFHPQQPWTRSDGRAFASCGWGYLGLG